MMTSILTSNRTYVFAALWLLMFLLAPFATFGQTPSADKAVYAQPLPTSVVPGEWFLATLRFDGDFGADFGKFDIKLDKEATSKGITMQSLSRIDGEERIIIRLLTDARLQPGLVTASFIVFAEQEQVFKLYVTVMATMPLPREFFSAAHKTAIGSVPLYSIELVEGGVQVNQNFQPCKSFKKVAEIYATILEKAGWEIVQNDVFPASGYVVARKGDSVATVGLYTDPIDGDRWVTVGVTR